MATDGHEQPLLAGVFGEQPSVAGVNAGHHRRLVGRELVVIRQVPAVMEEDEGDGTACECREEHEAAEDDAGDLHLWTGPGRSVESRTPQRIIVRPRVGMGSGAYPFTKRHK